MTKRFAVFGNPIAQSKSPMIHQHFAKQCGADITYSAVLIPIEEFSHEVKRFFAEHGDGLNITVPFKDNAYRLADELTPLAKSAEAVNTLYQRDGKLIGDNTDGLGLLNDLQANLNWSLADKRVLILGAGGAVKGILQPLIEAVPFNIVIANRTPEKATALAERFQKYLVTSQKTGNQTELTGVGFADLEGKFDVVINGTSASLDHSTLPIPSECLLNAKCYDMVYGAKDTAFIQQAKQAGANQTSDGWGMLVEQAKLAFELWTGLQADTGELLKLKPTH